MIERDPSYEDLLDDALGRLDPPAVLHPGEHCDVALRARVSGGGIGETLAVDGEAPGAIGFVERGYLFLASDATKAALEESHARNPAERMAPIMYCWIAEPKSPRAIPWLSTAGVDGGLPWACRWKAGSTRPALLHAFRRKARSLGAVFLQATR